MNYRVEKRTNLNINGAPCTILNVHLNCDLEQTPWCDNPDSWQVFFRNRVARLSLVHQKTVLSWQRFKYHQDCLVWYRKCSPKKKRKPDVVRKDVQWSTKNPHMLKKNGTQSETNKTGLPWSTNWTRTVNQKFPCITKVVRQQLKFHVRNVCFPSVLLLFVYLLVCFVYSIFMTRVY